MNDAGSCTDSREQAAHNKQRRMTMTSKPTDQMTTNELLREFAGGVGAMLGRQEALKAEIERIKHELDEEECDSKAGLQPEEG